jgi:hypothetical protein
MKSTGTRQAPLGTPPHNAYTFLMAGEAPHTVESRHCPICEYDLRGNTSGRCPECGTIIAAAAGSRLPWIYRTARGGIKAYGQTVAMLLFDPKRLAAETRRRVPLVPAARFHQESIALATIIGTGLIVICFLLRGARWEYWLNPTTETFFDTASLSNPLIILPLRVWADRLFFLVPLLPALYLALQASTWIYRQLFAIGRHTSDIARRRAVRIAYYGSGLVPLLMVIAGLAVALMLLCSDDWAWAVTGWRPVLQTAIALLIALGLIAFLRPTFVLLSLAGRSTVGRMLAMALAFPLVQAAVWIVILSATFWIFGYSTIAIWAMVN